jgi:hypothetical protein
MAKVLGGQSDNVSAIAIIGKHSHMGEIGVTIMQ